jgi:uncharacterized protein YjiS (DUF1127 family)
VTPPRCRIYCTAVNPSSDGRDQGPSASPDAARSTQGNRLMLIASSIALVRRYFLYRSQLADLSQLDERALRDIGISRGELATSVWRNTARTQMP